MKQTHVYSPASSSSPPMEKSEIPISSILGFNRSENFQSFDQEASIFLKKSQLKAIIFLKRPEFSDHFESYLSVGFPNGKLGNFTVDSKQYRSFAFGTWVLGNSIDFTKFFSEFDKDESELLFHRNDSATEKLEKLYIVVRSSSERSELLSSAHLSTVLSQIDIAYQRLSETKTHVDTVTPQQKKLTSLSQGWLLDRIGLMLDECNNKSVLSAFKEVITIFDVDRLYARSTTDLENLGLYAEATKDGVVPISDLLGTISQLGKSPMLDECFNSGQTICIDDTTSDKITDIVLKEYAKQVNVRSIMFLPLRHQNKVTGLLIAQNTHPRPWTKQEQMVLDTLSEVIGVVMFHDTTSKTLSENEERFETALSSASHGFWELNFKTKKVFISSTYLTLLGYPSSSKTIDYTSENPYIHIEDNRTIQKLIEQISRGNIQEYQREIRAFKNDGSVAWLLTRAKVVEFDENGNPAILMGSDIDITQLKKSETDLHLARQEADSANIAKSEFLARMSHEIRTPMNAIIGLDYLLLESELSDEQRSYATDIENSAKSLLSIINDILDFSKMEAGKMLLDNHHYETEDLASFLDQKFSQLNAEKNLQFSAAIDPNLPPDIEIDSIKLKQICSNLMSNAAKFTQEGSVNFCLKFESTPDKDKCKIKVSISDTGAGIKQKDLAILFDPFDQADGSSTRQYGGTGLGLTITKRLVEMMGGAIQVESEFGKGTTFTLYVMCQLPAVADLKSLSSASEPKSKPLEQLRVLLVEDNMINQKVAAGMMGKKGVEVVIANDGQEALNLCKEVGSGHFDAVFMDVEMPVMNGLEATRGIRSLSSHSNTPIIAMTAHNSDEEKLNCTAAGMSDYLAKPIDSQALFEMLSNLSQAST